MKIDLRNGKGQFVKGGTHSPEFRKKISQGLIGVKRLPPSKETRQKMRAAMIGRKFSEERLSKYHQYLREHPEFIKRGDKSKMWKGEDAGYQAKHIWVRKCLGSAKMCEDCGTTTAKRYEWANISGEYKRELSDYKQLCRSCHYFFDDIAGKIKTSRILNKKLKVNTR